MNTYLKNITAEKTAFGWVIKPTTVEECENASYIPVQDNSRTNREDRAVSKMVIGSYYSRKNSDEMRFEISANDIRTILVKDMENVLITHLACYVVSDQSDDKQTTFCLMIGIAFPDKGGRTFRMLTRRAPQEVAEQHVAYLDATSIVYHRRNGLLRTRQFLKVSERKSR